jgi:hypothetical protein
MFAGVHAMLDSLQWLAVNWKLCIASLALLPPIFGILHLLHFLIFVPEDEEEGVQPPPPLAAATRGKKKATKLA